MGASIDELLLAYARLGLQHWKTESLRVKMKARAIQVDIANNKGAAERAVTSPFQPFAENGNAMTLIPMPCKQNHVFAAFFAPWFGPAGRQGLSFDLVVLLRQGAPFAFRFEPGSHQSTGTHGYDHAQLSQLLGGGQVPLGGAVSPLPTTYPAFPIPSQDPVTRFLAMAVAMHGFPSGVDGVLDEAFKGQGNKHWTYLDMAAAMLNP